MTSPLSKLLAGAACSAMLSLPALAADLSIMPVAVHLDRQHDRTTVQVLNNGLEPVVLQADAIAWAREGGVDRDATTDELIVNPPLFRVEPGKTQVVRVGLRRQAADDHERTFRMVLREVPLAGDGGWPGVSGSVRVLVALRVPVYVAPSTVVRSERWEAHRDADGSVVAQLTNDGNVHLKIGALRLRSGGSGALAEERSSAVLFPGEVRSFRLRPPAASSDDALRLEVVTDQGAHDVALGPVVR